MIGFVAALAVLGGAAAAVGAVARPLHPERAAHATDMEHMEAANGLASFAGGYSFEPDRSRFARGRNVLRFRILGSHGAPAHDFDVEGGVRLHLIVVRRDLTGYAHVHPRLDADGSWTVPLTFRDAGVYRAFADFERGGAKTVLGRDLFVGGATRARPLPHPTTTARVDGYTVRLSAPPLRAGQEAELAFSVERGGRPVTRFDTYVGAHGHLVALHEGDLAYEHVHPTNGLAFAAELTEPGRYRLFLQFKVDGRVHTAPFTVEVRR